MKYSFEISEDIVEGGTRRISGESIDKNSGYDQEYRKYLIEVSCDHIRTVAESYHIIDEDNSIGVPSRDKFDENGIYEENWFTHYKIINGDIHRKDCEEVIIADNHNIRFLKYNMNFQEEYVDATKYLYDDNDDVYAEINYIGDDDIPDDFSFDDEEHCETRETYDTLNYLKYEFSDNSFEYEVCFTSEKDN